MIYFSLPGFLLHHYIYKYFFAIKQIKSHVLSLFGIQKFNQDKNT